MLQQLLFSLILLLTSPPTNSPPPASFPPVSLASVFSSDHTWTATISGQTTTLLSTGDILLARTLNSAAVSRSDFTFPFVPLRPLLASTGITFINLETPLPDSCPISAQGTIFCGRQDWLAGLQFAGIDVINLANNHAFNYGRAGLDQTVTLLTSAGLRISGLDHPALVQGRGVKFAFLGFNEVGGSAPPITPATDENITTHISSARAQADVIVVQFHWGQEYTTAPTSRQKHFAHLAVDSGADLILGNHPHWIQPVEIYHDVPILYSHGNFIFDQYWSTPTRQGLISRATFLGSRLIDLELLPLLIDFTGTPDLAPPDLSRHLLDQTFKISSP